MKPVGEWTQITSSDVTFSYVVPGVGIVPQLYEKVSRAYQNEHGLYFLQLSNGTLAKVQPGWVAMEIAATSGGEWI
jgi:hypothetical protein